MVTRTGAKFIIKTSLRILFRWLILPSVQQWPHALSRWKKVFSFGQFSLHFFQAAAKPVQRSDSLKTTFWVVSILFFSAISLSWIDLCFPVRYCVAGSLVS
jgi:hypothetical protein